MTWLTYRDAAKRVHRSTRAIKRWRANGMPMTFDTSGRRIVDEQVLLAWFRARLQADPVHQARMRALTHTTNHEIGRHDAVTE